MESLKYIKKHFSICQVEDTFEQYILNLIKYSVYRKKLLGEKEGKAVLMNCWKGVLYYYKLKITRIGGEKARKYFGLRNTAL